MSLYIYFIFVFVQVGFNLFGIIKFYGLVYFSKMPQIFMKMLTIIMRFYFINIIINSVCVFVYQDAFYTMKKAKLSTFVIEQRL